MKNISSITSLLPEEPLEEPQKQKTIKDNLIECTNVAINKIKSIKVNKAYLLLSPFIFFFITIFGIGFYLAFNFNSGAVLSGSDEQSYNVYTANPKQTSVYELDVETVDARPEKIKRFFEKHNAPLADHSEFIVEMADKYEIDWKLVSAIGMCEGNGGKFIPEGSYNTWGWAASQKDLAEKSGRYNLGSWENAIEIVTRGLKKGYIDQGLETPEEIMPKYAPPSVAKGGPWAKCVNEYMYKIDNTY